MLADYRNWLEAELKLLGNASHHAYSFGQANMAKRAIERLDAELEKTVYVPLERAQAMGVLTAIEALAEEKTAIPPELGDLRAALRAAFAETTERPAL